MTQPPSPNPSKLFSESLGSETESLTQELLVDQREHIDRYIAIADTKAAFLIGLLSASIVGLSQSSAGRHLLEPMSRWGGMDLFLIAAVVSLGVATALSMYVVRPRLINTAKKGLIPWLGISAFPNKEEYLKSFSAASRSHLIEDLASNVYDLSRIARRKYYWLGWSFLVTGAGLLMAVLACILSALKP